MSQKFLYLLLSVFAALETVSGTTVTTSRIHQVTFGPPPVRTQSESPTSTPALSSSTPTVESSQSTASSIETSSLPTSGALDLTTTTSFVKTSNLAGSPVQSTSATSSSTPSLSVSSSLPNSTTVILASAYLSSSPSLSSSPPGGKVSPASSVQGTASVGIQPTKQTTTSSSAGAKGKTIGGLEIVGFVLVAILGLLVAAFGFYFFFFRKKMYPEYWSELVESPAPTEPAAAAHTAFPEVGITHQAFVGDAESPTNVTAPETEEKAPEPEVKAAEPVVKTPDQEVKAAEPEVKVAEPEANVSEPEVKSEVKENEAAEENFSEDSAL